MSKEATIKVFIDDTEKVYDVEIICVDCRHPLTITDSGDGYRKGQLLFEVEACETCDADQCKQDLDAVHSDCQEALGHLHDAEVKLEQMEARALRAELREADRWLFAQGKPDTPEIAAKRARLAELIESKAS